MVAAALYYYVAYVFEENWDLYEPGEKFAYFVFQGLMLFLVCAEIFAEATLAFYIIGG